MYNYNQYNPYQRQYGNQNYQQPYIPTVQQAQQPIMPINNLQDVRYGTEDEIRGHLVYPNCKAIFIDRLKGMSYVKECNNNGESFIRYFKQVEVKADGTPLEPTKEQPKMDLSTFATKDDLTAFVSLKQYEELLNKFEELKSMLNKE